MGFRLLDEGGLDVAEGEPDGLDLGPEPEPHVHGDLVVPGPPGVDLAAHRPDLLGEPALDVQVDVFELDPVGEGAVLELDAHLGEPSEEGLQLRFREDAALGEGAGPRLAPLDVVGPEPVVEGQGGREGHRRGGGALSEATAPEGIRSRHRGTPVGAASGRSSTSRVAISSMMQPVISARRRCVRGRRLYRANRRGGPKRTRRGTRRGM